MLPASVLAALGAQALAGACRAAGRAPQPRGLRRPAAPWAAASRAAAVRALAAPAAAGAAGGGPAYAAMRADAAPGAVLELPPRTNDSRAMLNQVCHGRPLAGGYLARTPDYPPINGASATQRLWAAEAEQPDIFAHQPAAELAALGVRFVTLSTDQMSGSRAARLRALLEAPGLARWGSAPGLGGLRGGPGGGAPGALRRARLARARERRSAGVALDGRARRGAPAGARALGGGPRA